MSSKRDTPRARHADSTQLVRQWSLLRLLQGAPRSYTVKELAEQLGTSKSTIERDLATLEGQFPLVEESDGKQKRRYRITRGAALGEMQFGVSELLALHAFRQALPGVRGTPLADDLGAVIQKVRAALAEQKNCGIDALATVFAVHPRNFVDYGDKGEILDTLTDAVARRKECEVTYLPLHATTPTTHVVHPLRLVWHQGALYAFCWYARFGWVGLLAAQRIQALAPTGLTFKRPRVDLDTPLERAFGIFNGREADVRDVEIRFAPEVARAVGERTFHPAEKKHVAADGSLRYRVRTSARFEVVAFVQRFGGLAELIAPAEWRKDVCAGAEKMAAAHRGHEAGPDRCAP